MSATIPVTALGKRVAGDAAEAAGLKVAKQPRLSRESPGPGRDALTTTFVSETRLPTDFGDFRVRAYRCAGGASTQHGPPMEPVALICDAPVSGFEEHASTSGDSEGVDAPVAVRVHDACATSEIFGSRRCDCREQLHCAMAYAQQHGGIIIYLQQEGRGIGLANKIAAYALQEAGADTVDANRMLGFEDDLRRYDPVKAILDDIGVGRIHLMTNNPRKVSELKRLE